MKTTTKEKENDKIRFVKKWWKIGRANLSNKFCRNDDKIGGLMPKWQSGHGNIITEWFNYIEWRSSVIMKWHSNVKMKWQNVKMKWQNVKMKWQNIKMKWQNVKMKWHRMSKWNDTEYKNGITVMSKWNNTVISKWNEILPNVIKKFSIIS